MDDFVKEVEDKIQFATNHYSSRDGDQESVEEVYKAEFKVDPDSRDAGLTLVNVPTGQSIVKMFASYLGVGIDVKTQVLPLDESDEEQVRCTKLERYLAAVRYASEYEADSRSYQDFVFYFLFRGWGVFKTLFYPEYVDTYNFPIRILARDPHYVYPIFGLTGPLYVVEKYDRYVLDIKLELKALWDRKKNKEAIVWKKPDFGEYVDTEKIEVVEYWDHEFKGLRAGGNWVWLMPHNYQKKGERGIIPYSFAFCEKTPIADGKWMGRSILAPIMDVIKEQAKLMSKVTTATDVFFYPQILVETPHGESFTFSSTPGQGRPIPPGSKVTVLNPAPNQMLLTTLMAWYEKSISLFGLPDAMWGVQPGQVQAGYAISMLQQGAKTKINEKANEIQAAIARTHEHVLRLTEIFDPLTEGGFKLHPVEDVRMPRPTERRPHPLTITADDVAGHYRNRVTITPDLPNDQALMWRMAQMAREPHGVTQLPLASDAYIREEIVKLAHPDVEAERVLDQFLRTHPDVQEAQARIYVHQFLKDHKKELDKIDREEEKARAKEEKKMEQNMEEMMQKAYEEAVARGEVPAELMPAQQGMAPPGMAPPGMPPGAPPMTGEGSMMGMAPTELPPSFMGMSPNPPLPEDEMAVRMAERRLRGGPG